MSIAEVLAGKASWHIEVCDVLDGLARLPDGCAHCVVTSPPYWNLRDYGIAGQLGMEPTMEGYVQAMTAVFREVRRVLRGDGTCWVNLGDSYAGGGPHHGDSNTGKSGTNRGSQSGIDRTTPSLKPKDLCGIPWRLAFALQQPYEEPSCVKSPEDRAWLAAVFDGEGTFGIRRYDSWKEGSHCQDGFIAYTSVANSDVELLDRCVAITGIGRSAIKAKGGRAGDVDKRGVVSRRDNYGWRQDGNGAISIIKAIYPYLIAKRKQAVLAYTLDVLNKDRMARGNGPVPKEIQEKKELLKALIHRCNKRDTGIDLPSWCIEPKLEITPGWWLRSDIIWAKPNPMPESVTDRPTKAHEYLFLLSKSQNYYYDAVAVAEPGVMRDMNADTARLNNSRYLKDGRGETNEKFTLGVGTVTRNRRTVWTIPSEPFRDWLQTVHRVDVPLDAIDGDTKRTVSPGCPVHGGSSGMGAILSCDGHGGADPNHIEHNDDHPDQGQPSEPASIPLILGGGSVAESSDLPLQSRSGSAIVRNSQASKKAPAPETMRPYTPCAQTQSRTDGIPGQLVSSELHPDSDGSSTLKGGSGAHEPSRMADDTVDTPLRFRERGACTCSYYKEVTKSISHFATYPPALVEPCIKAGCPPFGLVLDPFSGAGTTAMVAVRLGRRAIGLELNAEYVAMSQRRILGDHGAEEADEQAREHQAQGRLALDGPGEA